MAIENSAINGINGTTGKPLRGLTDAQVMQHLNGMTPEKALTAKSTRGLGPSGPGSYSVAECGWGIIFAEADEERIDAIRENLLPLLNLRQSQTAHYHEFGQRNGDGRWIGYPQNLPPFASTAADLFLSTNGALLGDPIKPNKVPYYLLIVGSPATIPYEFQMRLNVDYAVGRIHFESLDEYAQYAQSVVDAADPSRAVQRTATFFGTENPNDPITKRSADELVRPLAKELDDTFNSAAMADRASDEATKWQIAQMIGEGQTEIDKLASVLGGEQTPSLLFTATHGVGFDLDDPLQDRHTGALLGQDWDLDPNSGAPMDEKFYFSADDLAADAQVHGSIIFHFACFSAGTPMNDQFPQVAGQVKKLAPEPMLARLPQKLLSHPKGGALAVVGHVERVWANSFRVFVPGSDAAKSAIGPFSSTLATIMHGGSVGAAFRPFPDRQDTFADHLASMQHQIQQLQQVNPSNAVRFWKLYNDARHYIVIGDPAVTLNLEDESNSVAGENAHNRERMSPINIQRASVANDRLLVGPYRHLTLADGTDVPFYMIPFDKNGVCQGPETLRRLVEDVKSGRFTDVFLFSHGWNTDWQAAVAGYERFQKGFSQMHQSHDLSMPDGYRPLMVGIFWPSAAMAFGEDETGPQIAGSALSSFEAFDSAVAIERREIQELAASLPREQAEQFYSLTQRAALTESEALELATIAQLFYRAEDEELGITEPTSPEEIVEIWAAALAELGTPLGDDNDDNDDSDTPDDDDAPGMAGIGDMLKKLDPRQVVRLLTVYQMKDRAGTVGALGVGPMLRDLLAADTDSQIHLIGHSFGCKVVLSALCHPEELPRPVDSLLLLQPAVNHLCFTENVLGRNHPGGYHSALGRVTQPILSTYSRQDFPLHKAFHLAVRRKSDIGEVDIAGVDGTPSRFAALGGYGPSGANEKLIPMPEVGQPYELDLAVDLYGVDGSSLIGSHTDVSNEATWWALHQQLRM